MADEAPGCALDRGRIHWEQPIDGADGRDLARTTTCDIACPAICYLPVAGTSIATCIVPSPK